MDLHLIVKDGFISGKIYDKIDDLDFGIVKFPYLEWDVPRRAFYCVYISQLIGLQECLVMLLTSTLEINYLLLNSKSRLSVP